MDGTPHTTDRPERSHRPGKHPARSARARGRLSGPSDWRDSITRYIERRFTLTPINRRRWQNFKANRRGFWSLWIFAVLFLLSMFAELIANDKPIVASYKGEILFPVLINYPEEKFGGFLAVTDYKDPFIKQEIENNGWMIWPPIRFSYNSINKDYPRIQGNANQCLGFPGPPPWATSAELCEAPADQIARYQALGNTNWLGTDDQGRDVVARLLYGLRISILFGLVLTAASAVIGVLLGAIQGYFGGRVDLILQSIL